MSLFKSGGSGASGDDSALNPQERRREHRVALFIRPAKLIVDGTEYLCIVRDVSQGGVRLKLFHPLPSGRIYEIELPNGTRRPLRHVWTSETFLGFEITNPIALREFIEEVSDTDHRKQVRINRRIQATIHAGDAVSQAMLQNISPQGALIECEMHIAIDQLVRLETGVLPPVIAKIRWRRPPHYGLIFEEVFQIDKLAVFLGPRTPDGSA